MTIMLIDITFCMQETDQITLHRLIWNSNWTRPSAVANQSWHRKIENIHTQTDKVEWLWSVARATPWEPLGSFPMRHNCDTNWHNRPPLYWENYVSIHIEWDMIVVTVFLSILNHMKIHLVQNRKDNCHNDHIPFNLKGNRILFLSV